MLKPLLNGIFSLGWNVFLLLQIKYNVLMPICITFLNFLKIFAKLTSPLLCKY